MGAPWQVSFEGSGDRFRVEVPQGARAVSVALDAVGAAKPFRAMVGATDGTPGMVNLLHQGDAEGDRSLRFLHLDVPSDATALHILISDPTGPFAGVGMPALGFRGPGKPVSRPFRVQVAFDGDG